MKEPITESEYRARMAYFWDNMPEVLRKAYHNDPIIHRAFDHATISGLTYIETLEVIIELQLKQAEEMRKALVDQAMARPITITLPV